MIRPCRETEEWLGQRAALNEAQRLALEQHLSECADCRALHGMSRAVSAVVAQASAGLAPAARERAISGALERIGKPPRVQQRPWLGRALAGVAVAAAALVIAFYSSLQPPADAWLEGAAVRTFAHASVTSSADARVRFDARSTTLSLARGAVEVEVNPEPHAPFAVETAKFRALVLGTSFHVDAERVIVRQGHVRVVQGERQLADLHAGERYEVQPATARAEPDPAPEGPVVVPPGQPETVRPTRPAPHARDERHAQPAREAAATQPRRAHAPAEVAAAPVARELLAQARAALARDALEETRALVARALSAARAADDHAEAGTLRAELALRERDTAAAIRAYLEVAERFPRLASGENALFAAAQLSAPDAALFARYLERYPQGRFAARVRTRLQGTAR